MKELITIVPTRSRPHHVQRVVRAWEDTHAFDDGAELHFVVDMDDERYDEYEDLLADVDLNRITWSSIGRWKPLVPKLNDAAMRLLTWPEITFALGFAGDDHVPRTDHWVATYVAALRDGAGIVYGDDGYQHEKIPTEWAMRADIVGALERMVPAPVDHLYCDNAIRDLGEATGLLRYLPEVSIEHLNPYADGKAPMDEQYARVNGAEQYRNDRPAYRQWRRNGLAEDAATVNALRKGETHHD